MKRIRYSLLLILAMAEMTVLAQTSGYKYQAQLQAVPTDAFYNIVLTPQINAHVKTDYSDFRIVNGTGKWVPHLIRVPTLERTETAVSWKLDFLKRHGIDETELTFRARDSVTSNIVLHMSNALAQRFCTVSGSNNSENWFTVSDSVLIIPQPDAKGNGATFTISFPPCSYQFFSVVIKEQSKKPLHITGISTVGKMGIANSATTFSTLQNPTPSIVQKDSGKLSFISITQQLPYHFETLSFTISGVKHFNRTAQIYIPNSTAHSFQNPGPLVHTFTITNNSSLQQRLPQVFNSKAFYLVIQNEDNPPLKVSAVNTYADYKVASVYLESKYNYRWIGGNDVAKAPNYDLTLEDIVAKDNLPTAEFGAVDALKQAPIVASEKDSSHLVIWLTIAMGGIVLVFFTYRLVADMGKQKK